jgi:hypothetical protein
MGCAAGIRPAWQRHMCHDQGGTNHGEDQTTGGAGSRERHRERCHAHGGTSAGQPIKISKCTKITKPGSYLVTRNLTAVGDCLVLEARNVTLDLGGWITGDGAEDSTGSQEGQAPPSVTGQSPISEVVSLSVAMSSRTCGPTANSPSTPGRQHPQP